MIAIVAAALIAAAPRAHPAAQVAVYLPRLDRLSELTPFLKAAGQRSALFHPDSWRGEVHPLLYVDLTDPAALASAGLDPAGSVTVSYLGDAKMTCTTLKDPKRFIERAGQRLSSVGQSWKSTAEGVPLVGASTGGRLVVGYALKGKEACAVQSSGSGVEFLLKDAAKVVLKPSSGPEWKRAASLPGAALVVTRIGAAGLKGAERTLQAEARLTRLPIPPLEAGGPSPFAGVAPSGMALLKAKVSPQGTEAMGRTLLAQLLDVCTRCDPDQMRTLAQELFPSLTGNVLLRVDSLKVRGSLRTLPARYFAVRHAWVVELNKPEAVKKVLEQLDSWKAARQTEEGWALSATGGEVLLGVRGPHLFVGNDHAAVEAAFAGLEGKAGRLSHGAEWVVDPPRIASGLSQIPLLDVLGSQELAALFAVSTELGPLLSASERISGWADSAGEGQHRLFSSWQLKAPAPASTGPRAR